MGICQTTIMKRCSIKVQFKHWFIKMCTTLCNKNERILTWLTFRNKFFTRAHRSLLFCHRFKYLYRLSRINVILSTLKRNILTNQVISLALTHYQLCIKTEDQSVTLSSCVVKTHLCIKTKTLVCLESNMSLSSSSHLSWRGDSNLSSLKTHTTCQFLTQGT
jgi:hypothetical protein